MQALNFLPSRHRVFTTACALTIAMAGLTGSVQAATPTELSTAYATQAGAAAQAERGRQFFTTTHGKEWSCASCHTALATQAGKHASTGKLIAAMAPAVNAERLTDPAKVEKWFRRNCNDVVGRECSALEKADVMSWLIALKP